ncbi:uncharacterized protein LOC126894063 isoform X2 [Daktulosphaira vitifoliae]|uniref:uncharacterized protein LOC126894063 isoform X2 n=1 Tax=Daktulosphaira vitifoliae TaxID=58002 RepID=UPI0021A9AE9B|nr:uncharacterized protein LOC126894063 isoform X2 [Daktulosphaira vitifoliae]
MKNWSDLVKLMYFVLICIYSNTEAAPTSNENNEVPVSFPRSVTELIEWEPFNEIWKKAIETEMMKQVGDNQGTVKSNMIGDFMISEKGQSGTCDLMAQGMTQMSGSMPGLGPLTTFTSSDNFSHAMCDVTKQSMTQAGTGMNGLYRHSNDEKVDITKVVNEYIRSKYHENAKKKLAKLFRCVTFKS